MDVWYSYFLFAVTGLCQVSFLMSIKDKLTISVATKIPKMTKMRSLVSDLVTCLVEVKIMGKKMLFSGLVFCKNMVINL